MNEETLFEEALSRSPEERAAFPGTGLRRPAGTPCGRRGAAGGARKVGQHPRQAAGTRPRIPDPARPGIRATGDHTSGPDDASPAATKTADYGPTSEPGSRHRGPVYAARKDRRRRHGRGLGRQADRAGQTQGRAQADQGRHGLQGRAAALRAGAAGPGHDGSSQHRPRARRRPDADRPAVLRHGAGQRPAADQVLRRSQADAPKSAWSSSCRSARRSSTPIRRASSTATSSRPTSW